MNNIEELLVLMKVLDDKKDRIFNFNEIDDIMEIEDKIHDKERYIREYENDEDFMMLSYRQLNDLKEDLKYAEERGFKKVIDVLSYYKIDYSRAVI